MTPAEERFARGLRALCAVHGVRMHERSGDGIVVEGPGFRLDVYEATADEVRGFDHEAMDVFVVERAVRVGSEATWRSGT